MPAPKTTHVEPASTFAVFIAAPIPVERPQANSAAPSSGASGLIFASAISGITVYSANVDVPMKCRIGSPSSVQARRAVRQEALVLLLADREAEVRAVAAAVDALAALRREERHHVVAGRERRHAVADLLDDAGALVPEHRRRVARRVSARGGVEIRVTDAARHEPHEHFPSSRLAQLHLAHGERLPERFQNGSSHTHRVRTFS